MARESADQGSSLPIAPSAEAVVETERFAPLLLLLLLLCGHSIARNLSLSLYLPDRYSSMNWSTWLGACSRE
jgi:hypothetical protein